MMAFDAVTWHYLIDDLIVLPIYFVICRPSHPAFQGAVVHLTP